MAKTRNNSSATVKKSHKATIQPTREQIAFRAYQIYMERGGAPGNELEDWTRAERELMGINNKPRRKTTHESITA